MTMATYHVKIYTGDRLFASTTNRIKVQLVGTGGDSSFEVASGFQTIFGADAEASISCPASLGELVLMRVQKYYWAINDSWYPSYAEVTHKDRTYYFPIYRWFNGEVIHSFQAGAALTIAKDTPLGLHHRQMELEAQKAEFRWKVHKEGIPHSLDAETPDDIPDRFQFGAVKSTEFFTTAAIGKLEIKVDGYADNIDNWENLEAIKGTLFKTTPVLEYVVNNWKDDGFFGYQYLNGINPILIQQCKCLPDNFPVTDELVRTIVEGSLSEEMEKGNIFLCDYKRLDGVKTNILDGVKQYLAAPLVLLHKTSDDKLKPIAIQLKQAPGKDNPIFLPTDSEYDWLLAKIFVRSADFNEHELVIHLLRTHLLAEVFAVSLLRNLPMVHPLYKVTEWKLLIQHTRYTLQINILARERLISEKGVFTEFTSSGGEGIFDILRRSTAAMTYSSLCLPEDIIQRGMDKVPHYYYRDDGLKLWGIIHSFVEEIVKFYYEENSDVKGDKELQEWIKDIYQHGFLSNESSGIPQSFSRVDEVIKFVTMVIFTCSCQHAAVNNGQYDYDAWLPNSPTTLQRGPPTKKGTGTEQLMLATLPNIKTTVNGVITVTLLSKPSDDFQALGSYPQMHFTEKTPRQLMAKFRDKLKKLSESIKERNKSLEVPYTYLHPEEIEESVSL